MKRAHGKTAVFSGTRQHREHVPRLEDLCIQLLMDNVNKIECVGDAPYYALRPMLTKISLSQLKRIESYNPQLVEEPESDELWKAHCEHYFEGRTPAKGETWRDLFRRCEREREHELEIVAKRIKKHEAKATPVRKARVVDEQLPGGGRSRGVASSIVIKKTIHNHIPSRGSSSSSPSTSQPTTRTIVIRRGPGATNGSATKMKQKTAPLMQKSMQILKNRFKR